MSNRTLKRAWYRFFGTKVTIRYRSGSKICFRCRECVVSRALDGSITQIKWAYAYPVPIYINIADVESVWGA